MNPATEKRRILLIALMCILFLGTAAVTLTDLGCTYRSTVAKAFDRLEKEFHAALVRCLDDDPRVPAEQGALLREQLNRFPTLAARLEKAYSPMTPPAFRFVEGHRPSPRCTVFLEAVKRAERDGLEPALFRYDELNARAKALRERPLALPVPVLDPEERAAMISAVAEGAADLPDLEPASLLKWLALPARNGKYPRFRAACEKAWLAFRDRAREECQAELDFAVEFFRYLEEMGTPADRMEESWREAAGDMARILEGLAPSDTRYVRLRAELARYRQLAEAHPDVPRLRVAPDGKLKPGTSGSDVAALQERLALEGYFRGTASGFYDEETRDAVKAFQRNHQVADDGVTGKDTVDSLNVPFGRRVDQIRLAMSKLRKSPTRREPFYVRVNIPEYIVEVVEKGRVLRTHRVVVGNLQEENHTPELQSTIEKIVYNPAWYITKRIFEKEEYVSYLKDKNYFAKKGYVVKYSASGRPVSAFEPPGPGNALGKVKILFPNKYDVYMHDTPKKALFATVNRAYSHGCIRLQNPLELVTDLLRRENNPVLPKVPKILEGKNTHWVTLKQKIPIFLEYCTVSVGADGRALFLRDVYKREQPKLAEMELRREKIVAAP
ncbi:MAG: L,D-transpeptidase family protein [Acidobacteria bacterium]|nr:L,D-transpeptidase family protein [Acidobacteriota bacterium]